MTLSALDENGNPIDWWFAYKIPKLTQDASTPSATGYEDVYYDTKVGKVDKSPNLLTDGKGAVDLTLSSVFNKPTDTIGWIVYNDEMPASVGGKDDGSLGHTKGVIAFDTASKTAFWMLHSWPKYANPGGARPPLFLLPGAGGSVMYFMPLVRHLPQDLPCWALQGLGHGEGEHIPDRVEDVAARYVELICNRQPEGPYFLAGHSFGALVAFEIARILERRGQSIAFLGLIDNRAPDVGEAAPVRNDIQWLRHIAMRIAKLTRTSINVATSGDAGLDYAVEVKAFVAQMEAARLLPSGIGADHFARFIEIYKTNAIAASRYRPEPLENVTGTTVIVASTNDHELELPEANGDTALGWGGLLPVSPWIEEVHGTHLTMIVEPHVGSLAIKIVAALDRATCTQE